MNAAHATGEVYGVSRVVDYIKRLISGNTKLKNIGVSGEVSNLHAHPSGRLYFDLKEGNDKLVCVAWATAARSLPPFANGDQVVAFGEFTTYSERSQYELIVAAVQRAGGIGDLHAHVEALREKFRREGLFELERKRPIPALARRVAIVSARGRGAEDFEKSVAVHGPHLSVQFFETRVQGTGAEIDIAEALDRASATDVDVIVLARGGGSFEDRFPFNLEPVIRAIVRSRHPVLTAIGHTADHHLADDVADHAVGTPSLAAQFFGDQRTRYLNRVHAAQKEMRKCFSALLTNKGRMLDERTTRLGHQARVFREGKEQVVLRLERRLDNKRPDAQLAERSRRLERARTRLDGTFVRSIDSARTRLAIASQTLLARDPHLELRRGYAIVTVDGKVVRDASDVSKGTLIEARLERGLLCARVEETRIDG